MGAEAPESDDACAGCGASVKSRREFKGNRQQPSIVRTGVLQCPICGMLHEPHTSECDCGYSFRRELTDGRQTVLDVASKNIMLGAALFVGSLVFAVVLLLFAPLISTFLIVSVLAGAAMFWRGLVQLSRVRKIPTAPED